MERVGAVRTVGLAHGHRGGLGQGPEHRARVADALFAARTAVGHRAAQVERGAGPETLPDLLLEVSLEVEPVEARVQADAVLLEVAAREVVAGFVGAAAHVQLVALNGGRAVDFVLPVGVGGQVVQVRVARGPAGINLGFIKVLGKLAGIKQVNLLAQRLLAVVGTQAHLGGAHLAFFGGNDHHAVGSPHAVNGRAGAIFQDGDVLDVVRVQGIEGVGPLVAHGQFLVIGGQNGNAVDNVKRRGVQAHRAIAADAHVDARAGRAGWCRYLHAGGLALQGLVETGHRLPLNGAGVDRSDGRGQLLAVLCAVAHHHHFVEGLFVLTHSNHQGSSGPGHGYFLAREPHRTEHQRAVFGHTQ